MIPVTFTISHSDEAMCRDVSDPEIFFPSSAKELEARKWAPYCNSCPIKKLCGEAVYEGFTGVAGGEFHGKISRNPEPRKRKSHTSKPSEYSFSTALGSVIRQRRLALGFTMREFSKIAFISIAHLSDVERGRKDLSSHALPKISEALGCPPSQVIREASIELELAEIASGLVPANQSS
jgi:hypothetical protein